jgi:hypothetical protein
MMGETCSTRQKKEEKLFLISIAGTEGRRPLGRPVHRWEGNIKVRLKETVWNGLIWLKTWFNSRIL